MARANICSEAETDNNSHGVRHPPRDHRDRSETKLFGLEISLRKQVLMIGRRSLYDKDCVRPIAVLFLSDAESQPTINVSGLKDQQAIDAANFTREEM